MAVKFILLKTDMGWVLFYMDNILSNLKINEDFGNTWMHSVPLISKASVIINININNRKRDSLKKMA